MKETLGCWIGDPGVSWTQWLILGSSTGVITPNIFVFWNPGNLHIAINHIGRATYDNQIDYTRNHGVITPNTRNLAKLSSNYNSMIIESGFGYEIWNDVLTLVGDSKYKNCNRSGGHICWNDYR